MIFLDSSFIIAYSNEDDGSHVRALGVAKKISASQYGRQMITDYVFDEVMTLLMSRTKDFRKAVETGQRLLDTTYLLNMSPDIFISSWKLFREQKKPRLSFTDCSIIATCTAYGIDTIATFDNALSEDSSMNVAN